MKYELTPDCLTGIAQIDKEHARLFELANEAFELITNEFMVDKYDAISDLLSELRDYTDTHFRHEEEYMEKIAYRKRFSQAVQHRKFMEKLNSYDLKKIDDSQNESLLSILDFLATWLTQHIKMMDCKIPAAQA